MDCYFSSWIASKWLGIIWLTNNSYKYHCVFVPENCYPLQLIFYHASLWRESCTWNNVTLLVIVSSPSFYYENGFSKQWCLGQRGDFILLRGSDGTNLVNIYAWGGIAVLEHPFHLPVQFINSTLKVIRKDNYKTLTVCSFNFHKIFLNINKTW